jgi:hypothetical protein
MTDAASTNSTAYNQAAIAAAIDNITAALERVMAGFITLKGLLVAEAQADTAELDPRDPANKYEVGGQMKLTRRGEDVCYRLFYVGKSRYTVASLMNISFGAATHRHNAWKKLGKPNGLKPPLD